MSWDEAEFEALFLQHYSSVYRLLYRIVGATGEADELAQEAFLRLYRQDFPSGRQHNLRAWLFRVATNLGLNALRDGNLRATREAQAGYESGGNNHNNPAKEAARNELRQGVRQTLANLPPRQAQLLLLRHAGLSYRELAEALGVSPSSVGTLLSRAHKAFKAYYPLDEAVLEEENPYEP